MKVTMASESELPALRREVVALRLETRRQAALIGELRAEIPNRCWSCARWRLRPDGVFHLCQLSCSTKAPADFCSDWEASQD